MKDKERDMWARKVYQLENLNYTEELKKQRLDTAARAGGFTIIDYEVYKLYTMSMGYIRIAIFGVAVLIGFVAGLLMSL